MSGKKIGEKNTKDINGPSWLWTAAFLLHHLQVGSIHRLIETGHPAAFQRVWNKKCCSNLTDAQGGYQKKQSQLRTLPIPENLPISSHPFDFLETESTSQGLPTPRWSSKSSWSPTWSPLPLEAPEGPGAPWSARHG